jgi:hypothetical protein
MWFPSFFFAHLDTIIKLDLTRDRSIQEIL